MFSPNVDSELKTARSRALVSICLNLLLTIIKGVAGVLSGSTALIGDAIHSGADVFASSVAFIGIWVAGRNHPSFPYGLYKAETVAALITSGVIIVAGYEIVRQALLGGHSVPDVGLALPVAALSFIIALVFGLYQLREGRRLHSPALKADARDYLTDCMSTGVVLIGLLATWIGIHVDRWAAVLVAFFVFRAGGILLVNAVRDLLDASIDRETEREIVHMVEGAPHVVKVKKILSRTAGGRFIVDMDVVMDTPAHKIADKIADNLEKEIPQEFNRVVMARVRPHYGRRDRVVRMEPVDRAGGEPVPYISSAPWFLIETRYRDSGTAYKEYVQNLYYKEENRRGLKVGQWLLSFKPDEICVHDAGSLEGTAVALLREAGVRVRKRIKMETANHCSREEKTAGQD